MHMTTPLNTHTHILSPILYSPGFVRWTREVSCLGLSFPWLFFPPPSFGLSASSVNDPESLMP